MKALLSWSGTHKAVGAPEALDHAGVGADPNGQLLGCGRLGVGGDSVVGLSVDQVMHEFGSFQTHLPERPAFLAPLRPADLSRIQPGAGAGAMRPAPPTASTTGP